MLTHRGACSLQCFCILASDRCCKLSRLKMMSGKVGIMLCRCPKWDSPMISEIFDTAYVSAVLLSTDFGGTFEDVSQHTCRHSIKKHLVFPLKFISLFIKYAAIKTYCNERSKKHFYNDIYKYDYTIFKKKLQDLVQFEQKNQAPIDVQDANFLKQFPSLDICKMFSSLYNGSHSLICVSVCGSPCLRPNRLV